MFLASLFPRSLPHISLLHLHPQAFDLIYFFYSSDLFPKIFDSSSPVRLCAQEIERGVEKLGALAAGDPPLASASRFRALRCSRLLPSHGLCRFAGVVKPPHGGGSSIRWESDPLFSAAEVVQDSADRMESLYRLLVHDWNLVHEENKDNKLLSSVQYHKRDLVTAVETTKWQLEDFERAVYFAASSDESGLRKNAISKHKQFIDAIREQILLVDKCLEEISTGDSNRSMQWTNMNEPDAVGLALFLSGSDSMNHHLQYNSENSIMKRFFDSTGTTDEIIEIEPEEVHLRVNDTRHLNHASNSSKDEKSWEFGSNHSEGPSSKSEGMWENGLKKSGGVLTCNTDIGKTKRKYLFANNNLIMYLSRLLNNFWFLNKRSFSRNFTKRRKDGEITDDIIVDIDGDGHTKNVSSAEQGLNFTGLASAMQVDKWLEALPRRFDRFQGVFRRITFDVRSAIVVLITVAILGLLVFSIA